MKNSIKKPEAQVMRFNRGIFDGDGCVTCGKYTNKMLEQKRNIVINFTGSVALLDFLKNYFYNHIGVVVGRGSVTGIPPPTHIVGRNKKTGEFSYNGPNAIAILSWLYDDSEEKTRLERKYEKFKKLKTYYD